MEPAHRLCKLLQGASLLAPRAGLGVEELAHVASS